MSVTHPDFESEQRYIDDAYDLLKTNLRRVNEVPRSELIEALSQTVQDAVSIEQDVLFVAVARLFGWKRVSNDVNAALTAAYREAMKTDLLESAGSGPVRRVN